MTDFHWHLVLVWWQVSLSIGILGAATAAYYWRGLYFNTSARMNKATRLLDKGKLGEARQLLSDH